MNIPADMLAEIDAAAEELFSSRSSAVRWLYRHKWSKSTSGCTDVHQSDITLHQPAQSSPDPAPAPAPAQAPAREHSPREKESERVRGDELADHWKTVEPFCLLPAPATTLAAMRRAYPGRDLEAETAKIELWWMERPAPKGKKRKKGERWFVSGIQAGIRGWLGRAREPTDHPAKPTQGSLAGLTEADWMAGNSDDGVEHV